MLGWSKKERGTEARLEQEGEAQRLGWSKKEGGTEARLEQEGERHRG